MRAQEVRKKNKYSNPVKSILKVALTDRIHLTTGPVQRTCLDDVT